MSTPKLTTTLSQHIKKLCNLRDQANQIQKSLRSANCIGDDFIDQMAPILQQIADHSIGIKHDLLKIQLEGMRISTLESISQLEKCIYETRGAVIHSLGNRYETSIDYSQIETKLCFLSLALGQLQDNLRRVHHHSIKTRLAPAGRTTSPKFNPKEFDILQSPN